LEQERSKLITSSGQFIELQHKLDEFDKRFEDQTEQLNALTSEKSILEQEVEAGKERLTENSRETNRLREEIVNLTNGLSDSKKQNDLVAELEHKIATITADYEVKVAFYLLINFKFFSPSWNRSATNPRALISKALNCKKNS
jgi:predicted nuclease with TOPRIM domain